MTLSSFFSARPLTVLLGAAGLWLGMSNPVLHLPLAALLYPAALVWLGLTAASGRGALRAGWLAGTLGASAALYWIAVPVHDFGMLPWVLAAPCAMALGSYVGLYGGVFAALAYAARTLPPWRLALVLGVGWFLLEWVRGWFGTGFPWLSLATAFAPWPAFIQGASVLGAYGLGGLFAGMVAWPISAWAWTRRERNAGRLAIVRAALLTSAALLVLVVFGQQRLSSMPQTNAQPVPVALIQGNVNQDVKWEPAMQKATVVRYLDVSISGLQKLNQRFGSASAGSAQRLLIWPETCMPFDFERALGLSAPIRDFATREHVDIILGSIGFDQVARKVLNRAYLVAPQTPAASMAWYEKEHLVPFGEYAPPWLKLPFLEPLLQGVGDFLPGRRVAPLQHASPVSTQGERDDASQHAVCEPLGEHNCAPSLDASSIDSSTELSTNPSTAASEPAFFEGSLLETAQNTPATDNASPFSLVSGVLICYESIFPELARARVAQGATVLINISNDAWFGRTSAPEQHLHLSLLRAVEQSRWLARSTNTGISAFVDPRGRVVARGGLFQAEAVVHTVTPVGEKTLFFTLAPWLPGVGLVLFCMLVYPLFRRKSFFKTHHGERR